MHHRFFHTPKLHLPSSQFEKKANWLELFYDLIYVAAFIQLGNILSENLDFKHITSFIGLFTALWFTWIGFTYYSNRFNVDDILHRLLVFIQMFAVGGMAMSIQGVLQGSYSNFAICYSLAQFVLCLMYTRTYLQEPKGRSYSKYWGMTFFISTLFWPLSLLFPFPPLIWAIGCCVIFIAPWLPSARAILEEFPFDQEHLSERFSLLTIIVLGESFVKVVSSLNTSLPQGSLILQASFALVLTCSIWWIYFDDIAESEIIEQKFSASLWLFPHLPLQMAIIAMGVAIKKVVGFDLLSELPHKYSLFLGVTLAAIFFSTASIDAVTQRKNTELNDKIRVTVRFISGTFILLLSLSPSTFNPLLFLSIVLFLCFGQVLFDIISAPMSIDEKHIDQIAPKMSDKLKNNPTSSTPKLYSLDPVRKGVPNDLKKDLYFFFLESSWSRIFLSLFSLYILVNTFFAAIYMIVPNALAENSVTSFRDAFFFSVQTLSTLGYGVLAPQSNLANLVVTFEVAVGLIGVAVVTGVIFAKITLPHAKIIFSKNILIQKVNGKDHLVLRLGNARGNDISQANVNISILIDEFSQEGEHFRKIYDLKLVRSRSPFFKMTWSVFHELDPLSSPLAKIYQTNPKDLIGVIVSVSGHDNTYGNTITAHHTYNPDLILRNHIFVDIIRELEDGRTLIDFDLFHQVKKTKA